MQDSNLRDFRQAVFRTAAINRSANSPENGGPCGIRTRDLRIDSPAFYPSELRVQVARVPAFRNPEDSVCPPGAHRTHRTAPGPTHGHDSHWRPLAGPKRRTVHVDEVGRARGRIGSNDHLRVLCAFARRLAAYQARRTIPSSAMRFLHSGFVLHPSPVFKWWRLWESNPLETCLQSRRNGRDAQAPFVRLPLSKIRRVNGALQLSPRVAAK